MDREEIRQHVVDALGVILVDKTVIEDNQTIDSLVLDEDDIDELSKMLQKSGINFKKRAREEALKHSESTTLMALIDHIFLSQH
ncbi:hypothetical protein [Pseudomonas caspiana]|uniref:Acyl carrier protein n=1 Tax=Pseudomonas caspiana TaxID=1451454 RepID=A0A1Y3NZ92_9PSED|nr:hypothetical protein [Pseudomonas caspiana]OUM71812.1 hypothetical protein AUC60_21015 [Pseudomonas caspiana]